MDGLGQRGSLNVDGNAVKVNWNPDNRKFYVNRYNLQNANPNLRSREVSRKFKELTLLFALQILTSRSSFWKFLRVVRINKDRFLYQ